MEGSGHHNATAVYQQGKKFRYPLSKRMGGTQSRSGRGGEEKSLCRESNSGRPAYSLVVILSYRTLQLADVNFYDPQFVYSRSRLIIHTTAV
jgi:hypothetical protein